MIQKLKNIDVFEKQQIEERLYYQLFNSSLWKNSQVIGITWSSDLEWNTKPIIDLGWMEHKEICIPKCKPITKEMDFYLINREEDVLRGFGNLMEPDDKITKRISKSQIELLIVPGIVFNNDGYRIGFGGGFYDRFLKNYHHKTVSLLSKHQLLKNVDFNEEHDIPVQYMITEDKCIKL